jgi:hypothetical protein
MNLTPGGGNREQSNEHPPGEVVINQSLYV